MSNFEGFQKAVFNSSKSLFGDAAVWTPSSGAETITDKVLYNTPNDPYKIGDSDAYQYRPYNYSFEYLKGTFAGLKESVDQGATEHVAIGNERLAIREVVSKFDGRTFIAFGELDEEL